MTRGIRHKDWNYGGNRWKLSRSKIDLFLECPRCFYLDNKLGIRRPSMPSFNINSAVDALLKKEFDTHRLDGTAHRLFEKFGIKAVPFQHKNIDTWRENFEGVQFKHPKFGITISGAVDDLWLLDDGMVAVVDYKSTAKDQLDMNTKWVQQYFRQLEVYQWLLRHNQINVSDTAYILYANGDLSADQFGGKISFKMSLHKHLGDTSWIDPVIEQIVNTLNNDQIPECSSDCEHCEFNQLQTRLESGKLETSKIQTQTMEKDNPEPKTLFD